MFSKNKSSKGFTIIELIVVIAIIAVLAAIVVTAVVIYIGRANDTAVRADMTQVAKQMYIHFAETGTYAGFAEPEITLPCHQDSFGINPSASSFAIYAQLCTSEHFWCVDSGGTAVEQSEAPSGSICDGSLCSPDCIGCNTCIGGTCTPDNSNCNPDQHCDSGTGNCVAGCDPVTNCIGKCAGESDGCLVNGVYGTCGSDNCSPGWVCFPSSGGSCCNVASNCAGKCNGADDGCGGQCWGECPTTQHCDTVNNTCVLNCGDGTCDPTIGEDCGNCVADCGECLSCQGTCSICSTLGSDDIACGTNCCSLHTDECDWVGGSIGCQGKTCSGDALTCSSFCISGGCSWQ